MCVYLENALKFLGKVSANVRDYSTTIMLIALLIISTFFAPLFTGRNAACRNIVFILSSPFNIRYEADTTNGLIQNYFFFMLMIFAFEVLANIEKWKNKMLVLLLALLASYSVTMYTCQFTDSIGVGSSILAFSIAIMLILAVYRTDNLFGKLTELLRMPVALLLLFIFVGGFLLVPSGREHALGGFFFLVLIFMALLLKFEIPFIRRIKTHEK